MTEITIYTRPTPPPSPAEQRAVAKAFKTQFMDELENHLGTRPKGLDSTYVTASRDIRPHREGGEPKPLLFAGNAYTIIYTHKLTVNDEPVSTHAIREAFNRTHDFFTEDRVVVDGVAHVILDPHLTEDGRIRFGFTGVHYAY